MPAPNYVPPMSDEQFRAARAIIDRLQGPVVRPKTYAEMTPAEIYQMHGTELAAYIVELRSSIDIWKGVACDRLKVDPDRMPNI